MSFIHPSWLKKGYTAMDVQKAEWRGYDRAVSSIMDEAKAEVFKSFFDAGGKARIAFEDDTIEFKIPREKFEVLKTKYEIKPTHTKLPQSGSKGDKV